MNQPDNERLSEQMKFLCIVAVIATVTWVPARGQVIGSPRALEARPSTTTGYVERQTFHFRAKGDQVRNAAVKGEAKDRNLVSEQRKTVYTGKNGRVAQEPAKPEPAR